MIFFNSYLTQPAQNEIPDVPDFNTGTGIRLTSRILGSEFIVDTANSSPETEIGEYILASLESFLATTMEMHTAIGDSRVFITITKDETLKLEIKFNNRKDYKLGLEIKTGDFNPHSLKRKDQEKINQSMFNIVITIVANSVIFNDSKVDLIKLFKDEEVSYRAFGFSSPMVSLGNVLGYNPKRKITDWIIDKNHEYKFDSKKSGKPIKKIATTKNEEPQDELKSKSSLKHSDIKNISIIRVHLWDKAGWQGMLFMTAKNYPPVLALLFENDDMSKAIFNDWLSTIGRKDVKEIIRVTILRGISRKNPAWYRAVITTNIDKKIISGDFFVIISRHCTMTPSSSENLDRFIESYKKFGFYLLAPAIFTKNKAAPVVKYELGIEKKFFNYKNAWEVGKNDLDIGGIREDDDVVIPKDITNVPMLELIKLIKERRNHK